MWGRVLTASPTRGLPGLASLVPGHRCPVSESTCKMCCEPSGDEVSVKACLRVRQNGVDAEAQNSHLGELSTLEGGQRLRSAGQSWLLSVVLPTGRPPAPPPVLVSPRGAAVLGDRCQGKISPCFLLEKQVVRCLLSQCFFKCSPQVSRVSPTRKLVRKPGLEACPPVCWTSQLAVGPGGLRASDAPDPLSR